MSEDLEKISGYSSIEFKANQVVEGFLTGLHKSPFHGFSVEFADTRAYNTGESTRHIDWKLFARTDKLFVKKYEEETNLRCLLVLDNSSSMCFPLEKKGDFTNPNKLSFSIYACGAIISMLYKQRDAFGISLISNKIDYLSEIKSNFAHKRHVYTLLEQLMDKKTKDFPTDTKIDTIIHQLSEAIHRRSLVIIFTDLLSNSTEDDFIHSLQHLKHNKHEVILFHVIDKQKEEDLVFKNRPYRFIDIETKEEVKMNPTQIQQEYEQTMQDKFNKIHNACNQMQIDFVPCDINKDFSQILLPFFIKRTRMR